MTDTNINLYELKNEYDHTKLDLINPRDRKSIHDWGKVKEIYEHISQLSTVPYQVSNQEVNYCC